MVLAVAFGLGAVLPRGQYTHTRDLMYVVRPGSNGSNENGEENEDDVERGILDQELQSMHVKLIFDDGLELKRSYSKEDSVSEQFITDP